MRALALLLLGAALVSSGSATAHSASPTARVQLGILGDPQRFQRLTGQRSDIHQAFMGLEARSTDKLLAHLAPLPMLAVKTGGVAPLDIAQGRADASLVALNRALAGFGSRVYVRPMPEMNGHWNPYCAFNSDGSSRGARFSTAAFRRAFARIALIARGGPAARINAKLRKVGGPPVAGDLPRSAARIVWNPQGYGAPDVPGNAPRAYYPGDAFVDVVANDLYDQRFNAAWDANEKLYAAHPRKPYAIGEWGLWGIDDPAFVERMAEFVKTHRRVEFIAYFNSKPGSLWDLGSKPRSRAAYQRSITPLGR